MATTKENGAMGRIRVEVDLANNFDVLKQEEGTLAADRVRRVRLPAIIDPGATHLVLPEEVATQLGLASAGTAVVKYADRREGTRKVVKEVWVQLEGRQGSFKAILEPLRKDALIGAIVLEDLDLLADCRMQKVVPRDPKSIVAELE